MARSHPNGTRAFPRRATSSIGMAALSLFMLVFIAAAPEWSPIILPLVAGVMIVGLFLGFGSLTRREKPRLFGRIAVALNLLVPFFFAVYTLTRM